MSADFGEHSCVVAVGRFKNPEGKPFTMYSRDKDKQANNVYYWQEYFRNYIKHGPWKGKVQEYAIYRCHEKKMLGDPLVKNDL